MGASVGGNNRFVSEINVTPFVDVMLVLLIIFMVATPMMSQGLEVDLPQTKQVEVLPTENDNMMLTVRHDGKIFLDEYEVQTMDDLEGYLQTLVKEKNKTLFLRADKEVPYGVVVDVMGRIKAVGIEKQMLKKALEDEVNDKRLYCQRQANREFFGDSPAGVRQEGYLEEVDGLTPEALTEAYDEMLRTANIELIVLGCDEASTTAVKDALLTELSAIDRAPLPRAENIAMPRREPVRKVEHFDTTQAKLCMLFTTGEANPNPPSVSILRVAMSVLGSASARSENTRALSGSWNASTRCVSQLPMMERARASP